MNERQRNPLCPDFVAEDGTVFTEIEVTVQSDDGDMHDAVHLVETLRRAHGASTMREKKVGPSDFLAEIERLNAAGEAADAGGSSRCRRRDTTGVHTENPETR